MNNTYLIGCGGVGSWAAAALARMGSPRKLILVDGDRLEKKNLDRQLFKESDIGENKAQALSEAYGCEHEPAWFSMGQFDLDDTDWLFIAADNHPARLSALQECDSNGCQCVIAANETWSAEACVYRPEWRGGPMDYRTYCPEVLTSRSGDPRGAAIGCTGEAQERNRQLINANLMAASLALHLFALWKNQYKTLNDLARQHLPHRIVQNMTKTEIYKPSQYQK